MKLRQGRRVQEHIYVQLGDDPADSDIPLFTVPSVDLAQIVVVATNYLCAQSAAVQDTFDMAGGELAAQREA